ncbi:MAG: hypothetical protein ACO3LE_01495 [Bdellovibrionota bacterium]
MLTLISLIMIFSMPSDRIEDWDDFENDHEFNFYLGEFIENNLDELHPLQVLIQDRLVENFFETSDQKVFQSRLRKLNQAFENHPKALLRFESLNEALYEEFNQKIKKAKTMRWIFTAGGAAAGALVAFPVTKMFARKAARSILLLSVPLGAISGAGAGFLLSDFLFMPDYQFDGLNVSSDLLLGLEDLKKTLGE